MPILIKGSGGGADLSVVTATANDVRSGKAFVNSNGEVVNGTKPTKTSSNISFISQSGSKSVRVESGIYDSDSYKTIPNSYESVSKLLNSNDFEIFEEGANTGLKLHLPSGISQFSSDSIINMNLRVSFPVSGGIRVYEFAINTHPTINGLKYHALYGAWFENYSGTKDLFFTDVKDESNPTISDQNIIFFIYDPFGFDYENFTFQSGWLTVFNPIIW